MQNPVSIRRPVVGLLHVVKIYTSYGPDDGYEGYTAIAVLRVFIRKTGRFVR